jgi:SAM-dependent methyltransferase
MIWWKRSITQAAQRVSAPRMNRHDPAAYGETHATEYDLLYPAEYFDTEPAASTLASLARSVSGGEPSVLEFGIGTGRLALPLLDHGVRVAGIEASAAMVRELRAKPRGEDLDVVVGDFATTHAGGTFSVVVLALNGITDPPSRDDQIACFRNAERHLEPGGCFVVETAVLHRDELDGDWTIWPRIVAHEHVELQLSRYDVASGVLERTLVHLRPDGVRFLTVKDNYAWPGELDLMARAADLRLRSRHGGWRDEVFDAASRRHVSVYERSDAGRTGSPPGRRRERP